MKYITVPFSKSYSREKFKSGEPTLDNYIQRQVSQDIKKRLCVCFLLIEDNEVIGYYTLSNHSIPLQDIPNQLRKKMPRSYTNLPSTLLGRLAIHENHKEKGYGKLLLIDALKRSNEASISTTGSMSVIVDPLNNNAKLFYQKYGFIELPDSGKMFLPMQTISKLSF